MINMDDPRHARLRRIVSRGFTPRRLADLTDEVRAHRHATIVDDVDRAGRVRRGHRDLRPAPAEDRLRHDGRAGEPVRLRLRPHQRHPRRRRPGVRPGRRQHHHRAAAGGRRPGRADARPGPRTASTNPTDDVTSALVNAEIDGERLTPDELASFFILLVVAGNETTRNAISWGLHLLTEHPDQRAAWLADLDGVTPTAVEEIVRWASPVIYMRRTLASRRRARRAADGRGRQGRAVLLGGQPRPGALPRPRRASTSAARPTRTSASAAPARTSAWARTWPAGR